MRGGDDHEDIPEKLVEMFGTLTGQGIRGTVVVSPEFWGAGRTHLPCSWNKPASHLQTFSPFLSSLQHSPPCLRFSRFSTDDFAFHLTGKKRITKLKQPCPPSTESRKAAHFTDLPHCSSHSGGWTAPPIKGSSTAP